MKDITAVVVNWLTARRTLGAIDSFRKFYPNVPLILVDDASDPKYESKFFRVYRGLYRNASHEYDPDCEGLMVLDDLDNTKYVQGPDLGIHPRSHGHCVDLAMKEIDTTWMFHFHSDYRLLREGFLEALMDGIDETYCGVGDKKGASPGRLVLRNVASLYNVKAGKKHGVTFRPVICYADGTIDTQPLLVGQKGRGAESMEAGGYFVKELHRLGYKVKWMPRVHQIYGVHLRWLKEKGEWNGPY